MPTVVAPYRFKGTVTIDLSSIAAGAGSVVDVGVTGLRANAPTLAWPAADFNAGLLWQACCIQDDQLRLYVVNVTGGAIDPASMTWHVVQF